jgi:hypothetical protein
MLSPIAVTFDCTEKMQGAGHMYTIEKLTLAAGKTAEFSEIAELSAKQ